MTIIEAITYIDNIKPNTYSQEDKVKWLSNLDCTIKNEIIDTHEGADAIQFSGYGDDTDIHTELLVPSPHDDMYHKWLEAQIDYANGEYGKYNNSMTMFNTAYSAYANYYNRTHMPLGTKMVFFGETRNKGRYICPHCGEAFDRKGRYCTHCGEEIYAEDPLNQANE